MENFESKPRQPAENKEENPDKEQERLLNELPLKFQAVVVLGESWRETPPENTSEKWKLHLSMQSKISAIAAGEMYKNGLTDKIIFSGGKTAGENWPSEAEAMREFLKKKYPGIPNEAILTEEKSIDTVDNAERVMPILEQYGLKNVALLTIGFHLARSKTIFENAGISVHGFPSEEMLKKKSPHYEEFLDNFLSSKTVKIKELKEAILRGLLVFDTQGKIPRVLAKKFRGNE